MIWFSPKARLKPAVATNSMRLKWFISRKSLLHQYGFQASKMGYPQGNIKFEMLILGVQWARIIAQSFTTKKLSVDIMAQTICNDIHSPIKCNTDGAYELKCAVKHVCNYSSVNCKQKDENIISSRKLHETEWQKNVDIPKIPRRPRPWNIWSCQSTGRNKK